MHVRRSLTVISGGTAALLVVLAGPALAVTDAEKCESAIELASGKYALCRLLAESKFTKSGDAAKLGSALTTCAGKLATAYDKAFGHWGGSCPTVEPASEFQAYLDQCTAALEVPAQGGSFPTCGDGTINVAGEQCDGGDLGGESCASLGLAGGTLGCTGGCALDASGCTTNTNPSLPATGQTTCWDSAAAVIACAGTGHDGELQAGATLAYVDNGDGTITDVNTGLMWEKLSDDLSVHDRDRSYTWDNAFAVKLATLNSGSFAGHTDWRLPNVKELQSIVNLENTSPAVSPAFNTACLPNCTVLTCNCISLGLYWSSSTYANFPGDAWGVDFFAGISNRASKTVLRSVRAVRGGS